jgi:hypothetical protein
MRTSIYTTWPLLASVIILILNDHVFKYAFPGLITGKISDFFGIFIFILVLRSIFQKQTFTIYLSVAIAFIWWKSTYSQGLIEFINTHSPLLIARTIDYSDLVAVIVIPLSHYMYEQRSKYSINIKLAELIKIPVIGITALGIMGTSVIMPHHNYEIRKEVKSEKIDIPKAIEIIEREMEYHGLKCVKCSPSEKKGLFKNKEIELKYKILENDRGIEFDITGEPGGLFFGSGSWDEMDTIQGRLQNALGNEFEGMEFVIKLGNR